MRAASEMFPPTRRRSFPISRCVCAVGALRLQGKMRTIIAKLPPEANFSTEMAEIRVWLDKHRCAPSMFKYHLAQESVIIQVEFDKDEEAEVFKRYYDKRTAI
jgi:hypothetical protein